MQQAVDARANLYTINGRGHTALIWTCNFKTDALSKVKFLSNHDFELFSHVTTNRAFRALHRAALEGQVDVCEYLLQQGADVDKQIRNKSSSMPLAASTAIQMP